MISSERQAGRKVGSYTQQELLVEIVSEGWNTFIGYIHNSSKQLLLLRSARQTDFW